MGDHTASYSGLESGASTANTFSNKAADTLSKIGEAKTTLTDQSVFMGPAQEDCAQQISSLDADLTEIQQNFTEMANYVLEAESKYKSGDKAAADNLINQATGGGSATSSSKAGKNTKGSGATTVNIPSDVNQAGYTVTCYGEGGWYLGGGSTPTAVASGTNQKLVHEAWLADGGRYKNGIAVMNVDGKDHYLIATAPTLGEVGDSVDVNLENGQTVPCVIADSKSTNDSNYTTYGHGRSDGSVNILEFEVDRDKYNSSGNPTTDTWGLEWDSSSDVTSVDNYGTVV